MRGVIVGCLIATYKDDAICFCGESPSQLHPFILPIELLLQLKVISSFGSIKNGYSLPGL